MVCNGANRKDPRVVTGERKGEQEQGCQHKTTEQLPVRSIQKGQNNICNAMELSSYQTFEGTGRMKAEEGKGKQKQAPKDTRKTTSSHPSFEVRSYERFKFM